MTSPPNRKRNAAELPPGARTKISRQRRAIEVLDAKILSLISRRLDAARRIGATKCAHGIPLRNYEVETQVLQRIEGLAEELGLQAGLARDLALFLIDHSLKIQSPLIERAYAGDLLRVLVVGGCGGMGRWVADYLNGQGHQIRILDPSPSPSPFPRVGSLQDGVADADLILLAVPMSICPGILEELTALRPRGVVGEMCSFKSHLLPALERLGRAGVPFVSFHPLFGPSANLLSGKKIVFVTESGAGATALLKGLFAGTSAELVSLSAQEHDRRMAVILGMMHLSNIGLARALEKSGIAFGQLSRTAGVTFQKQVATTREVASENAFLYFEIQAFNPEAERVGRLLVEALEDVLRTVAEDDRDAFLRIMGDADRFFADGSPA